MSLKTKWMSRIAIVVVGICLVNYLATRYVWFTLIWWFDMPMHFMGGFFVALVALWLARYTLLAKRILGRYRGNYILVGMVAAFVVGIGWEVFEFSLQSITLVTLATPLDSLSDMFFDLAGGAAAILYVLDQLGSAREGEKSAI
jgi:hypothetical protein